MAHLITLYHPYRNGGPSPNGGGSAHQNPRLIEAFQALAAVDNRLEKEHQDAERNRRK